jgi:hypothetical protein
VLLAAAVTLAAALFSLLLDWYYAPYFAAANPSPLTPLGPGLFDLRGVAFAAWTLAAFSIGALSGMLIRRVVPAIVATLAAYAGLAFVTGGWLREHYLTPQLASSLLNVPGSAWVLSQSWTKAGHFAFSGRPTGAVLIQLNCAGPPSSGKEDNPSLLTVTRCIAQRGYTQWTSYQPASRFWAMQWIEGGWLLALSVLLIAATVWLVRRRAA